MDLTKYNVNVSDDNKSGIEPGRYILNYAGEEKKPLEGKKNWRGHKMYFEVDGTGITISHAFTIGHDDPRYVDWGVKSMLLMSQAMGFTSPPTDTETQMIGKSVSAELVRGDSGYLEINEQFGKTWQPAKGSPKPKVVSEKPIQAGPSEADLQAMGSSVADDDDVPF